MGFGRCQDGFLNKRLQRLFMVVGACLELDLGYDGKLRCMSNERLAQAQILGPAGGKQTGQAAAGPHIMSRARSSGCGK